jgi:hypothetical protein
MEAPFPINPSITHGILFDNHCCDNKAFEFCHKHNAGFTIAPMMVAENKRETLFNEVREKGVAIQLLLLDEKGERFMWIPPSGQISPKQIQDTMSIWATKIHPLYEIDAELFHGIALMFENAPIEIYELLKSDHPQIEGWPQDAMHIHLMKFLARVIERHLGLTLDSRVQKAATKFLDELRSDDRKKWLNKIYDAEFARYAASSEQLLLRTNDRLLKEIAQSMSAKVVDDIFEKID